MIQGGFSSGSTSPANHIPHDDGDASEYEIEYQSNRACPQIHHNGIESNRYSSSRRPVNTDLDSRGGDIEAIQSNRSNREVGNDIVRRNDVVRQDRRRSRSPRHDESSFIINDSRESVRQRPVSKAVVSSLSRSWRRNDVHDIECSICTENVQEGQNVVELNCAHVFHADCLLQWTERKGTCPACRAPVDTALFAAAEAAASFGF